MSITLLSDSIGLLKFILVIKFRFEIILPSGSLPQSACTLSCGHWSVVIGNDGRLRLTKPCNPFTILPFSLSFGLIYAVIEDTGTVLEFFRKLANIFVTVSHVFYSMTLSLSVLEVAFVSALIWPCHLTFSMDLVIDELTFISLSGVDKVIFAFAMELSVDEITFINISVLLITCPASFLSFNKLTFVDTLTFIPSFNALTMLFIGFPFTFVNCLVSLVYENTFTMRFTINPFSLVNVTVSVGHSSLANHGFVFDLASIHRAILVFDITKTLPHSFVFLLELSFILSLFIDLRPIVIPD